MTTLLRYTATYALLCTFLLMNANAGPKKAPNFQLKTKDGVVVELEKLSGKVVVLNFWATWCPPCRAEMPGFISVYKKLKSKGVEVIGISLDQKGWSVVEPFVKNNEIPYPVVVDDFTVAKLYGEISGIPTTFIVDRKGNIQDSHVGYMSADELERLVRKYL